MATTAPPEEEDAGRPAPKWRWEWDKDRYKARKAKDDDANTVTTLYKSRTFLWWAANYGDLQEVHWAVQHGASRTAGVGSPFGSPLTAAVATHRREVVAYLACLVAVVGVDASEAAELRLPEVGEQCLMEADDLAAELGLADVREFLQLVLQNLEKLRHLKNCGVVKGITLAQVQAVLQTHPDGPRPFAVCLEELKHLADPAAYIVTLTRPAEVATPMPGEYVLASERTGAVEALKHMCAC